MSQPVQTQDLILTHPQPLMLKDIDMHKLAMNIPCRQISKKWFGQPPSPAGLFSQLGSGKHLYNISAYQSDKLGDRLVRDRSVDVRNTCLPPT